MSDLPLSPQQPTNSQHPTHQPHRTAQRPALGDGPLARWHETAGVRVGVRRRFQDETEQGKIFFPDHLVPYLAHEALAGLPPVRRRELTVRHLYQFLIATTHLETRIVNLAAERIANDRSGVDASLSLRQDAFKVYCDEGYHALYSLDLADQVAATTGIPIPGWDYGGFVTQLETAGAKLLPDAPVLAELLRAVVFETLVTSVLNELPADPTVVTTVGEVMRDHARDEGRHHRFFSAFFELLWTQLDASVRVEVAHAMPPLIHACLRWDTAPVFSSIVLAGVDPSTARDVVDAVYGDAPALRSVTRATVNLCESTGVLDVPGAREVFAAHGLYPRADGEPR